MSGKIGNNNASGKRSDEFREACRKRMLGRKLHTKPHSDETKQKIREAKTGKMTGPDNPNWKGGYTRTERNKFMRTRPYQNWRKAVFERDNYTCVFCGAHGVYLEADHIFKYAEYPELRIDVDNGRTLCKECHKKVTFMKRENK
jgi:5-methylcytosine-specific restriction endonuclease McrA